MNERYKKILKEKTSNLYQYQASTESPVQAMPRPQNPDLVNRNRFSPIGLERLMEYLIVSPFGRVLCSFVVCCFVVFFFLNVCLSCSISIITVC